MDVLINSAMTTTLMAFGILLIRWLFRDKISPQLQGLLWLLLAFRMIVPTSLTIPLNTFTVVPSINIAKTESLSIEGAPASVVPTRNIVVGEVQFNQLNASFQVEMSTINTFFLIWLTGVVLTLGYFLLSYFIFCQKVRSADSYANGAAQDLLGRCKKQVGVKSPVVMKQFGKTPMLKGVVQPLILLPVGYNDEDLEMILIHELCHLKYRDNLSIYLGLLLLAVYWFNPIIWLCFILFKRDLEVLCDERVLHLVDNKEAYMMLLLKTATSQSHPWVLNTNMYDEKNQIKRRVQYMCRSKRPNLLWSTLMIILILTLTLSIFTSACAPVNAKASQQTNNTSLFSNITIKDGYQFTDYLWFTSKSDFFAKSKMDEKTSVLSQQGTLTLISDKKTQSYNNPKAEMFPVFYFSDDKLTKVQLNALFSDEKSFTACVSELKGVIDQYPQPRRGSSSFLDQVPPETGDALGDAIWVGNDESSMHISTVYNPNSARDNYKYVISIEMRPPSTRN